MINIIKLVYFKKEDESISLSTVNILSKAFGLI